MSKNENSVMSIEHRPGWDYPQILAPGVHKSLVHSNWPQPTVFLLENINLLI